MFKGFQLLSAIHFIVHSFFITLQPKTLGIAPMLVSCFSDNSMMLPEDYELCIINYELFQQWILNTMLS